MLNLALNFMLLALGFWLFLLQIKDFKLIVPE